MEFHYPDTDRQPAVEANVVFGTLSKNCRGVGICKVEVKQGPTASGSAGCDPAAEAWLEKMPDGCIRFSFQKKDLSPYLRNRFFRHFEFPVPEDFTFRAPLLEALELSGFTIRAGVYPVKDAGPYLQVSFRHAKAPIFKQASRGFAIRREKLRRQMMRSHLL